MITTSRMLRGTALATLLLALAAAPARTDEPATAVAAAPDLLPAADVIARHVQAIGGADAVQAQKARVARGRFEMPAAGIAGTFEMKAAQPNRFVMSLEIPGMGTVRQGFDGTTAWAINPMVGPMLLDGEMKGQIEDQSAWDSGLFTAEQYPERETVAREEFNGAPAWKVRMVSKRGTEAANYFDVESGLHVGTTATAETAFGPIETTAVLSDYKDVGGVRMPMRVEQDLGPQGKQVMVFEEVRVEDVSPETFALPAEIQALAAAPAKP